MNFERRDTMKGHGIILVAVAGMILAAVAMLASAGDIKVPIPTQTVSVTTSNIVVNAEHGVNNDPNTGTWIVKATAEMQGTGTVTTNGATKRLKVVMPLDIEVTRADIVAFYSVTTNDYDNLTIKQLRDAVWAIAPAKAVQIIQTPITEGE